MPVHMQLCEDREFLTKMLDNELGSGVTLQTNSDTSHSDSDFDCSAILSHSDNNTELDHSESRTYKKFHAEKVKPFTSKIGSSNLNTQTGINEQMLHQLSVLSLRIDSMEHITCKKSNDPKKIKHSRVGKNTHLPCASKISDPAPQVTQFCVLVALKQES